MAPPKVPENRALGQVMKLEKQLATLTDTTLSDTELLNMGIRRAPPLNVDDPNASDSWPVFFQPVEDSVELREAVAKLGTELGNWSYCPYEAEHVDRLACALHTLGWFTYMRDEVVDFHPSGAPVWIQLNYSRSEGPRLPHYSASDNYLRKHRHRPSQPLPEWFTSTAFCIKEMLHVGCCVADNTPHRQGTALRSEIAAAVSLMRRRMQVAGGAGFPVPVVVYSMYHNETARITQVCWEPDGSITFRQSRLLDMTSRSFDTPDVFLLIRWMGCVALRNPKQAGKLGAPKIDGATTTAHTGNATPERASHARAEGWKPPC
ncbi:hypothetical protein MFIFM68171_05966 [Madurella fahalii]|uniref:Uncharacterized protein n=1 Tax=Madurella fahalii TaxID=1157608 RepID=A0ABQ0GDC2_9PEZI